MEMYTLGQDDIMGNIPPRKNPETIEEHRKECQELFKHAHAHAVITVSLGADRELGLPPGTLE